MAPDARIADPKGSTPMTASEVFIRRDSHPLHPVVYRWHGRLWRCSEAEWKRLLAEQIKEKVR